MCYTLSSCRSGFVFLLASLVMLDAATAQPGDGSAIELPYDKSCPVIYDNDNSIADKLVVAYLDNYRDGMYGFNGWSDGRAAYILLQKLRLIQFTYDSNPFVSVPKDRLQNELPASPERAFLLEIQPDVVAPVGDAAGSPAISIMRKDYVLETKRVSFGGWKTADGHEVPMFKDDPKGRALVAIKVDSRIATEEWWRALKSPAAWAPW